MVALGVKGRHDTGDNALVFFVPLSNFTFAEKINPSGSNFCYSDNAKDDCESVTEYKQMLAHLHMLVNKEYLAIPKEHDKLIISLRTAFTNSTLLTRNRLVTQTVLTP